MSLTSWMDTFTGRTVAGGWGTASDGQAWVQVAGTDTLAVGAGAGTITNATSAAANRMVLGSDIVADAQARACMTYADLVGDSIGVLLRCDATGANHYLFRPTPGSTTQIEIDKRVAGTLSTIATFASGVTIANGVHLRVAGQIVGSKLWIKAWIDGTAEPATWAGSINDTALASGGYGLYCGGQPTAVEGFTSFSGNLIFPGQPLQGNGRFAHL